METKDYNNSINYLNQYLIKLGEVDGIQTIVILNNQFIFYSITKLDIFNKLKESSVFFFNNRYSINVFYGIMPNIGAIGVSTIEEF